MKNIYKYIKNQNNNNNKGFTLIELLIVIGLTGLAVAITADILLSVTRSYNRTQIQNELEQQSSFVSSKLNKELKDAVDIIEPTDISKPSTTLKFKTQLDGEDKTITYFLKDNVLYRTETVGGSTSDEIPLTSKDGLQGIYVECGEEPPCFVLNNKSPKIISYSFIFSKPPEYDINAETNLSNTVVIRGSY